MIDPCVSAAVLLPLLIVLICLAGMPPASRAEAGAYLRKHWVKIIVLALLSGVPPGIVALLWGFANASYVSGCVFILCVGALFTGSIGPQWVGPGAAELNQGDKALAILAIGPSLLWTIVLFVLASTIKFDGLLS